MIKNSAIVAIVDSYDKFTEVEKLIADYFIKNKHKEDFSIKNISHILSGGLVHKTFHTTYTWIFIYFWFLAIL